MNASETEAVEQLNSGLDSGTWANMRIRMIGL
ncbi:hypothetical protein SDC9_95883 [bioreactor metagenome]|uniref:Uncharacterized protein n=1 Tax=bioreactor metagenome TaxID=1076179 RepID=A0A645A7J2_9ZZZZ